MRTTALLLATLLALSATPARAEEQVVTHQRGFLTHLGVGFFIGGMAGLGVGVAAMLSLADTSILLNAYGSFPTAEEQPTVKALETRMTVTSVLAGVGLVAGAVATAVGIGCILGDAPRAQVAFVPTAQGGVFVLSGRF